MIDYGIWLLLGLTLYLMIRLTILSNKVNLIEDWVAETDSWLDDEEKYIVLDIELDKEEHSEDSKH
jgi:hypothetical protein